MATDARSKLAEARAQGLSYYWAFMHTGEIREFLSCSWEAAGYKTDAIGAAIRDADGYTVHACEVQTLSEDNPRHAEVVRDLLP